MTDRQYNNITTASLVIVIASGIIFPDAGTWRIPVLIVGCVGAIGSVVCYFLFHWNDGECNVPTQIVGSNKIVPKVNESTRPQNTIAMEADDLYFRQITAIEGKWSRHHDVLSRMITGEHMAQRWAIRACQSQRNQEELIEIISRLAHKNEPFSIEFEITASGNLLVRSRTSTMTNDCRKGLAVRRRSAKEQAWLPRGVGVAT
jgi:hypothetical protein